jgi:EmrB/QacA subfamily drug resistance transporter
MEQSKPLASGAGSLNKWWIFFAVGTGTFMSALDGSVVNTILPVIRTYFKSDIAGVEWAVVIYLLVVSSLLLSFGRLGDLRGHKGIYIWGFVIFVGASAMCGLAPTVGILVGARAVQALGAAMLFANSPAILTKSFPPSQRGQALGMQATMTYLGLTVGPSLGGWLTQTFGWRAVFYINVPVGLLAFLLSVRFIEAEDPATTHAERFDGVGALLFSVGLLALMLGLNEGHDWGWTSPAILGCLATAAALLVAFVWWENRQVAPMLDLSLFKVRVFSAATASALLNYVCLYFVVFLMPFYLMQGRNLGPAQAGLFLTAQPIIMAIAAPISGSLSDRMGSRLLSTLGMAILAVGLFLLSRLGPASPDSLVLGGLAIAGLGTGIFISPNTSALLGSAPRQRQGIASGILATARNVGMVLGVGLAGAILTSLTVSDGPAALFSAVSVGFMVASGLAVVGILISSVRGKTAPANH